MLAPSRQEHVCEAGFYLLSISLSPDQPSIVGGRGEQEFRWSHDAVGYKPTFGAVSQQQS